MLPNRRLLACLFSAPFFALVVSCANVSTLQTARTLDPNEDRILVGAGFARVADEKSDYDVSSPYFEFGYRRGVAAFFEVAAKFTLVGTLAGEVKYQLMNEGDFALASGFGVGFLKAKWSAQEQIFVDVIVPIIASYHPAEAFAVYVSPKYFLRSAETSVTAIGATLGMRFGTDSGIFLEGSFLDFIDSDGQTVQMNGSIYW